MSDSITAEYKPLNCRKASSCMHKTTLAIAVLFFIFIIPFASASFIVENEVKEPTATYFTLRNDDASSGSPDNVIPYTGSEYGQLCKRFESPYEIYNKIYAIDLYGFDGPDEYVNLGVKIFSDENGKPKANLYDASHGMGKSNKNLRWLNLSIATAPDTNGKFFWVCLTNLQSSNYGYLRFDNDGNPDNTDYYYKSDGSWQHLSRTYTIRARMLTPSFNEPEPTPPPAPSVDSEITILKNEGASSSAPDNIIPPSTVGKLCKTFTSPTTDLNLVDVEVVGLDGGAQTFNLDIYNDNSGKLGSNIESASKFQFVKDGLHGKLPSKLSVKPEQKFWVCLSSATSDYGYLRFDDGTKNTEFILENNGNWKPAHTSRTYSIRAHMKKGVAKPTITFADKPSIGACGAFTSETILVGWEKTESCQGILNSDVSAPLIYFYTNPIEGSGCNNGLNSLGATSNCFISPAHLILPPPNTLPSNTDVKDIDCKMGLSKTCMVTQPLPSEPSKYYSKMESRETFFSWDVLEDRIKSLDNELKSVDVASLSDSKIKELAEKIAPIAKDVSRANSVILDCDIAHEERLKNNGHVNRDYIDEITGGIIVGTCIDSREARSIKMRAIDMEKDLIFAFREFTYKLDPSLKDLQEMEKIDQATNTFYLLLLPVSELKSLFYILEMVKTTIEPISVSLKSTYLTKCGFDLHKAMFNIELSKGDIQWLKSSEGAQEIINSIISCKG